MDNFIDELNEQHSSFVTKAHLMVSNLTNLDEPLECAVLAYRYHRDYSWRMSLEYPHRIYCVSHLQIKRRGR